MSEQVAEADAEREALEVERQKLSEQRYVFTTERMIPIRLGDWMKVKDVVPIIKRLINADARTSKQLAEIGRLREALMDVRSTIIAADPEVLTDTLWLTGACPETAVDRIDAALGEQAAADDGERA